jgi:hypothetical protein
MKTTRAIFFASIGVLAATAAYAQQPSPAGGPLGFSGQTAAAGPRQAPTQARPLFTIGGLPIGIWAPVPPPYDAAANRNAAANPLW